MSDAVPPTTALPPPSENKETPSPAGAKKHLPMPYRASADETNPTHHHAGLNAGGLTVQQQELADALGVDTEVVPLQPKIRDQEQHPKAFPSTYHPPQPDADPLRKSRGNTAGIAKGEHGHKSIQQIGGAYGVYRH